MKTVAGGREPASNSADQATGEPQTGSPGSTDFGNAVPSPATLIYNVNAGSSTGIEPNALQTMLLDAGFEPVYHATERAEELNEIFAATEGLVVVAGGDGTIREVAKRLNGKGRPISILPLGTANNTARTLGVEGTVKQIIAGLANPRSVPLDLARARGPWGEETVVEGAGLGLFANVLSAYRPDEGKSLLRAVGAAANTLGIDAPVRCRLELDGIGFDGEYLLVEVMNMRAIGPRLTLAPEADPGDGFLDLVLVKHENRDALFAYLRGLMTGGLRELPSVDVKRGRNLRVNWRGSAFHVDGISLCDEARESDTKGLSAQIEILPAALEVWLPGAEDEGA
jgi:diacylglycerol kinase (ATP)